MTSTTPDQAAAETPVRKIEADVPIPPRSRTFTEDDARRVLALFKGEAEGQDGTPAQNVGYGEYESLAAARSAAVALNRILASLGAPHKYASTTRVRDGKVVGILLNRAAKQPKPKDETAPATPARRRGGRTAS